MRRACCVALAILAATVACNPAPTGTQAACDTLANAISDTGGPDALAATTPEEWADLAARYRRSLNDTTDPLVSDSADILARTTDAPHSARMLALDTAANRCTNAGWTPS